MSNEDPWDDLPKGAYWKPENIGDTIAGTIVRKGLGTDYNNNLCPQLGLETADGERIVNAGQAQLKAKLMELKPKVGDKIRITFSSTEKAAKGDKKMFTVEHKAAEPVAATDLF